MNDSHSILDLSAAGLSEAAHQRRQTMLPGLLVAVKRRRRRRQAVRTVAALAVIGIVGLVAQSFWGPADPATPSRDREQTAWTTFRDDPATVERYSVATVTRSEWFLDDDSLNTLLRDAGRQSGIVRTPRGVIVNAAAIDPWPASGVDE